MTSMTDIWCNRLALVTLARRMARRQRSFTTAELLGWCPELKTEKTARFACSSLRTAGLLEAAPARHPTDNRNPHNPAKWQFTGLGWEAAKAAQAAAASTSRSSTMAELNREPKGRPLPQKLWTLLCARRRITSIEAAELLGDAADDNHRAMVKAVGRYLSAWAKVAPELVSIGARRNAGCRQYVLVADVAPHQMPAKLRNAESAAQAMRNTGAQP
jgi:hypothetical protein